MEKIVTWTGGAGNGLWFDPGNWSAGVPNSHEVALFDVFGESAPIDVSLAPAQFDHPVAGSVTMTDGGDYVFEPGRLAVTQGGLTVEVGTSLTIARGAIVDARNTQGGHGVTVSSATLTVHGTLHANDLAVLLGPGPAPTQMLVSGHAARVTVAGTTLVDGASGMTVAGGARFATSALTIETEGLDIGRLNVDGAGTLARVGSLTLYNSDIFVSDGAEMPLGGGSETVDPNAPYPDAVFNIGGIGGGTVRLAGQFTQDAGSLEIGKGGQLVLQAGATLVASDFVELARGGAITGPGALVLAGATLEVDGPGPYTLKHGVTLTGSGTLFAHDGMLTVDGAISGAHATLTVLSDTSRVVLTNPADTYGATDLGGTLELAANDVIGSGPIRFLANNPSTLQVDAGVSVGNTLLGFGASDTIDLAGIAYGPRTTLDLMPRLYGGATLTVSDGTHAEHLVLGTVGNPAGYTLASDGHGGTDVGYTPPS